MNFSVSYNKLEIGVSKPLLVRTEKFQDNNNFKLLFISDIHLNFYNYNLVCKQLIATVSSCSPDLILLGGDLVDSRSMLKHLDSLLSQIIRVAPIATVFGNHDRSVGLKRIKQVLVKNNVQSIDQEPLIYTKHNQKYFISERQSPDPDFNGIKIFCSHYPKKFKKALRQGYDYAFAGHYHGCQFVLKEKNNKLYPGALFVPWHGLRFKENNCNMIVSRGVADTLPIRWNCPREVVLCNI